MKELLGAISSHRAVLFVGAGATIDGGGLSWKDLSEYVASKCGIKPLSSPQETIDELCDVLKRREEVYSIVQDRLAKVVPGRSLCSILSVPWLTIYTTNYDTAIEDFYRSRNVLSPRVHLKPPRVVQFGVPGQILIFKAMGCRTVEPGHQGEMVLSGIDRIRHRMEESEMYYHLDGVVTAGAVLVIGYSFADNMLMDAIQTIRALRVNQNVAVYVVFKPGSKNSLIERLKKMGVVVIEEDLAKFADDLVRGVNATPVEAQIDARVGGSSFLVRANSIRDTLQAFDVVTESECRKYISIDDFLRGRTSRAGAYEEKLQWLRNPMYKGRHILDQWMGRKSGACLIVNYSGRPGSGRTVGSNDLLHYAVTNYRCIGLRAPVRCPRLNSLAASQLMTYLAESGRSSPVENLVVLTDEHSSLDDVLDFIYGIETGGAGTIVIRSGEKPLEIRVNLQSIEVHDIELSDTIPEADVTTLSQYLAALPSDIRPARMTVEDIEIAVKREGSFLELMYSLVDPSRRSIKDIVLDEYAALGSEAKSVMQFLILPSSAGAAMPITLLAKMHGKGIPFLYEVLEECKKLVRIDEDGIQMPYVSLYHRRAAEILLSIPSIQKDMHDVMINMVGRANLRGGSEHQLIADLLVGIPGLGAPVDRLFDQGQVLDVFNAARAHGASRLILHHYGLRLRNMKEYDLAMEVLNEAVEAVEDGSWSTERKEIVLTTLAHMRWIKLKESAPDYDEKDPTIQGIREDLRRARLNVKWNPHSYGIESSILEDIASRTEGKHRLELLGEALGLLHEGLTVAGGGESYLVERIETVLESSKGFGEDDAKDLRAKYGSGHGYYLLYERARSRGDSKKANELLDNALNAKNPCPPALRSAIEIELMDAVDPDYEKAKKYSDALVDFEAANPRTFHLTWIDHLQRLVCLVGSGNGKSAGPEIAEVRRFAPRNIPRPFPYFIRSNGSRKSYSGRIGEISSSTVGTVVDHDVPGLRTPVFFNPSRGKVPTVFVSGDLVKFYLAFGVLGISAWDVTRM